MLSWMVLLTSLAAAQDAPPADASPPEAAVDAPADEASSGGLANATSYKTYAPVYTMEIGVGGGTMREPDLGMGGAGLLHIAASYWITDAWRMGLSFTDHLYQRDAITTNPSLDGSGLQRVTSAEQYQDLRLDFSTDVLALAGGGLAEHARLELQLAPRYQHFANPTLGSWGGGLRGGIAATLFPAESLHFVLGTGTGVKLFGSPDTLAVSGNPFFFNDYRVGMGFDFGETPRWTVDLSWQADQIVYERSRRTLHAGVLTLQFAY